MTVVASIGVAGVEAIRAQFPALARVHRGHPVAYFDGPGGTQVAQPVVEAMTDYLYHHNANTHWAYPSSAETDRLIEEARAAVADFLNASADEIAFGLNMTTLTFHLGRALGQVADGTGCGRGLFLTCAKELAERLRGVLDEIIPPMSERAAKMAGHDEQNEPQHK